MIVMMLYICVALSEYAKHLICTIMAMFLQKPSEEKKKYSYPSMTAGVETSLSKAS